MYYMDLAIHSANETPFPEDVEAKKSELEAVNQKAKELLKGKK